MGLIQSVAPAIWRLVSTPRVEGVGASYTAAYSSRSGGVPPLADVYLPAHASGRSVVLVHGGGFILGRRDMNAVRFIADGLVREGLAVVSVDYRLIFRGGRLDEALSDVITAARWWRAELGDHGLDTDDVTLVGFSAGAALSILASVELPWITRLAGVYGCYDFTRLPGHPWSLGPRVLLGTSDPREWERRSPLAAPTHRGPLYLQHGLADTLIDASHSRRMVQAREQAGLPVRASWYPDVSHGFYQEGERHPTSVSARADLVRFLSE